MSPVKLKPLVDEVAREAVRRARQISFDSEFRPARQYAQQFGIELIRHDCCHYSARWESFILNIFPSNLRLVSDPHRPKTPRLELPDEWGLQHIINAIVRTMAGTSDGLLVWDDTLAFLKRAKFENGEYIVRTGDDHTLWTAEFHTYSSRSGRGRYPTEDGAKAACEKHAASN